MNYSYIQKPRNLTCTLYQLMMEQCYERHLANVVQGCGGDKDEVLTGR